MKALLEGVAFEMRLNLGILEQSRCQVNELQTIGGGAKSQIWTQLKADVLGKPITVLDITEAGCLGVAMLARAADTDISIADIAKQWVRPISVIQPRSDFTNCYSERFEKYKALYPFLKGLL